MSLYKLRLVEGKLQGSFRLIEWPTTVAIFAKNKLSGCTANVCFITEEEIYSTNAGDARCLASIGGKAVPLSFDHKPED